jgi:aspartate carbamoyltransferase catalytic subunit
MSPDAIVIRHPGAARLLADIIDCPVINAGDGRHEHPTQALLDLLTIRQRKQQIAGLTVTIVGDILHSRVARSNLHGLRTLGAKVRLCGPPTLLPQEFAALGAELYFDLASAVRDADVVMMLRIQRERQGQLHSTSTVRACCCLTSAREAKPDVIILHGPEPRHRDRKRRMTGLTGDDEPSRQRRGHA